MKRECGKILGHGETCIKERQCANCAELDRKDEEIADLKKQINNLQNMYDSAYETATETRVIDGMVFEKAMNREGEPYWVLQGNELPRLKERT